MVIINGKSLSIKELINVSRFHEKVTLDPSCVGLICQSAKAIKLIQQSSKPAYGINTGFGIFSNKKISQTESKKLNRNLILSHAIGFGDSFSEEVVRAAMLIRANSLAKGFSGVRLEIIETLLAMLNSDLTPVVKNKGSLGSSGDLCMLSQLALVFTKDERDDEKESGTALFQGEILPGKLAMEKAGIPRLELSAKEGLAIINGATFSAAIASLTCFDAEYCLQMANLAASLSLEAILARSAAFDSRLHQVRGLAGQSIIAKEILKNIKGSSLIDSADQIQDPYSFRCIPQVHGPIMDTLSPVKEVIHREINAATDNPLIFEDEVISGGNFHGEPIALNMDYLSIAMTELSAIAERRVFIILDEHLNNGLPPMLVGSTKLAGINSGVMIPQYVAASLVLENRVLATPDSIQSLPTSANQEDFNANALAAAKHAFEITRNTLYIMAIELFVAARAVNLRLIINPEQKLGNETNKVFENIGSLSPFHEDDSLWNKNIELIHQGIINHRIFN